jgi:hypothetical protein
MLIVAHFVLVILGAIIDFYSESLLPEPLRQYEKIQIEEVIAFGEWGLLAVLTVLGLAVLVSFIGLFVFWPPARPLYLVSSVANILVTPYLGPYIEAGWSRMFFDTVVLLDGVILALVYFSPLKELYEPEKR